MGRRCGRQRQRVHLHLSTPEGTRVALIQQTGKISQAINLAAGAYTASFAAAQRGSSPSNSQTIEVLVDSQVIGVFTPLA
jgi:hypothetical protein